MCPNHAFSNRKAGFWSSLTGVGVANGVRWAKFSSSWQPRSDKSVWGVFQMALLCVCVLPDKQGSSRFWSCVNESVRLRRRQSARWAKFSSSLVSKIQQKCERGVTNGASPWMSLAPLEGSTGWIPWTHHSGASGRNIADVFKINNSPEENPHRPEENKTVFCTYSSVGTIPSFS